MILHRGDIYRVRLNPTEGREQQGAARPCLVVHRESLRNAGTAIVLPLTTQQPSVGFPLVVHLPAGMGNLQQDNWVKITQIRVVSETRFLKPLIGSLSEGDLERIKSALQNVLDL